MLLITNIQAIEAGINENQTISNDNIDDCDCGKIVYTNSNENLFPIMSDPIYVDLSKKDQDFSKLTVLDTPDEFSWKNNEGFDWTSPAKNQGACGSCWDFASIGAFEGVINIQENCPNLNPDLSEQYVLSCLPAAANNYGQGCRGGNPFRALDCIMNDTSYGNNCNGVVLESCFPYQASHDISCNNKCENWEEQLVPLTNCGEQWFDIDMSNPEYVEVIKSQLLLHGPIAAGINVDNSFTNFWYFVDNPDSYFPDPDMPWENMINHIISIVGWKDDPSIGNGGYWICKNSWGRDWGYDGFFNIEYGGLFIGIVIVWAEYDPDSFDWAPIADAGSFYEGTVGEEINFDGSNSYDAEGEIVSYSWDFGDGTSSVDIAPSHTYSESRIYTVTLTVTDNGNQQSTDTIFVGIDESPIEIDFSGGLELTVSIKNIGNTDLLNKNWNVDFTGLLIKTIATDGVTEFIGSGDIYEIIFPVFGIGPCSIIVSFDGYTVTNRFLIIGKLVLTS